MFRVFVFGVVALALANPGRADDKKTADKKADPAGVKSPGEAGKLDATSLLVGKWVRTDKYVGTTMDYAPNGTYVTRRVISPGQLSNGMPGTWKLDGDKLIQTLGPYRTDTTVTITKLTETEFHFKNRAGQEATYERVTEKTAEKKK